MPLNRRSKIKEVWRHPVGREMLQAMLRKQNRSKRWLENPLVANMALQSMDRFAGPGFADMVLEMAANEPEHAVRAAREEQAWWKETVIYQVFLPSFMDSDHDGLGDLGGVLQRLPYLERLGVETVWLWPFNGPAVETGTVCNLRTVHEEYGRNEDVEALLEALHGRGMRLVLGVDIDATSDEHPWFKKALKDKGDDFYIFRPGVPDVPPNNWWREGQGSVWSWYADAGMWGLHTQGPHRMDLNWENPAVRAEIAGALRFWRDLGVDGFCFGHVNLLSKASFENGNPAAMDVAGLCGYEKMAYGPRLHRYLRELRAALGSGGMFVAGRTEGVGTETAKLFTGDGKELDAVLDTAHLAARAYGRDGEPRLDLGAVREYYLQWMEDYGAERWMTLLLVTPETARVVSRLGANPLYRPVLAKLLAAMLLTLRGTPVVYQGQELGLGNTRFASVKELQDPAALRLYNQFIDQLGEQAAFQRAVAVSADNTRVPMPWRAGAGAGFTGAQPWKRLPDGADYLNAAAQMEDANSTWRFYQRLIALRKKNPCLVYGSFNPVFTNNQKVFCYFRILEGEKWYVELNLTEKEIARPGRILQSQKLALSNYDTLAKRLRPYEANVYRCE